jgi:hypothetical protein
MRAVNTSPKTQFLKLPLNKPNEYFEKLIKVIEHNGTVFDLTRSIVTSHKDVTHFLLVCAQKESLSPRAQMAVQVPFGVRIDNEAATDGTIPVFFAQGGMGESYQPLS